VADEVVGEDEDEEVVIEVVFVADEVAVVVVHEVVAYVAVEDVDEVVVAVEAEVVPEERKLMLNHIVMQVYLLLDQKMMICY
jgi:hypothetical protein